MLRYFVQSIFVGAMTSVAFSISRHAFGAEITPWVAHPVAVVLALACVEITRLKAELAECNKERAQTIKLLHDIAEWLCVPPGADIPSWLSEWHVGFRKWGE
jgi:hypothetical protein